MGHRNKHLLPGLLLLSTLAASLPLRAQGQMERVPPNNQTPDTTIGREAARSLKQVGKVEVLSETYGADVDSYVRNGVLPYLRALWHDYTPSELRQPVEKRGEAAVEFDIVTSGNATNLLVASSSGDPDIDSSAMDAIAKASPFDDLPPDFPGQYLRLRCHLFYNPGKFVHLQIVDAEGNPLKQPALAKQEDNDEAGSHNSMPRILHQTFPEYTDKARRAKVNGVVVLKLTVNEAGDVSHARVVKGLGYGLDENAVRAVQSWKFKPAMKDGAPIEKEIAVEVSFRVY